MNVQDAFTAQRSTLERFLASCLFAVALVGITGGAFLVVTKTKSDEPLVLALLVALALPVVVSSFGLVGLVLVFRLRKNPLGWLFLVVALSLTTIFTGESYALRGLKEAPGSLPGAHFAAWLLTWAFMPMVASLTIFLPLLFPTGRLLSRRWRPVLWGGLLSLGLVIFSNALATSEPIPTIQNPFAIPRLMPLLRVLQSVTLPVLLLSVAGATTSLVIRYRRSRGIERQQMKWFIFAGVLAPTPFIAYEINEAASEILIPLVAPLFPIAVAIAIFRYRLYEIDVVINKTVVYGGLAAFITAVYVGVVVGIGSLVGAGREPNLGLSLLATALVAVAFQPVRGRVQRFANRLVYGERVTPYEAITSFSHRMAESLSLDQVLPQMAEAAAKGVDGSRSQVKLLLPGGREQVVSWPTDSSGDSFDRTILVSHQGEQVGEISVSKGPGEQINRSEEKLLSDLASQAGLAMRNLRLTGELQQKLIELQESRKRIVAAQDEERRRMERDITDGPQQQLGRIAAKLGLAHSLARRDSNKAALVLDEVKVESDAAIESVRDLARGLFPKILADRGLSAAIEAHISKTGIRAIVQDETNGTRFSPDVEANVYFCIREALQIAGKKPAAASIAVSLAIDNSALEFSVRDVGQAESATLGPSLQNIRDRTEALGGHLDIQSGQDKRTELQARIPIRTEP